MHCHLLPKINTKEKIITLDILKDLKYEFKKPSTIKLMKLLNISKSTYYDYKSRKLTKSQNNKVEIQNEMITIFENSGKVYGIDKIRNALVTKHGDTKHIPSRATINRYIHEIRLTPVISTRFKVKNGKSQKDSFILNNYLCFWKPTSYGTHFVTDITYVHTQEDGWVYLLSYMDLHTRQIVAFDVSDTMDANWVTGVLNHVIHNFPNIQMVHSDRGTQYKSEIYKNTLSGNGIIQSYSKKGYPYDNAWIESFHKVIKQEKLKHKQIKNLPHAFKLCCEYIITFYNTTRIHSSIGYSTPNDFAKSYIESAI